MDTQEFCPEYRREVEKQIMRKISRNVKREYRKAGLKPVCPFATESVRRPVFSVLADKPRRTRAEHEAILKSYSPDISPATSIEDVDLRDVELVCALIEHVQREGRAKSEKTWERMDGEPKGARMTSRLVNNKLSYHDDRY